MCWTSYIAFEKNNDNNKNKYINKEQNEWIYEDLFLFFIWYNFIEILTVTK